MRTMAVFAGLVMWVAAEAVGGMGKGALAQESAPPLPTAEQIKAQVEAGQYRPALQSLLRVLNLKGALAEGYDRFAMLMLRAECQLQVKETRSALDTLEQAKKEAAGKADPDRVGEAAAMTLLIQRSPGMKYTPKTSTGPLAKKPIDILDRTTRQEAYKALFEDELATARATVRRAEAAAALPPLMEAAKAAGVLRGLEKAATGDVLQSKELTDGLASHAALLVSNGVNDLSLRTEAIAARANTIVTTPMAQRDPVSKTARMVDVSHRRGVTGDEVAELKKILNECTQAVGAARDLALVLPTQEKSFKASAASATTIGTRANAVLNDNYNDLQPAPITPIFPTAPGGIILK
jgi:hypothetical protein